MTQPQKSPLSRGMRLRAFVDGRRRSKEKGNDLIVTLFLLPIILGLIFVSLDFGLYMQTRATVQNIARDGARQVALYGGADNNQTPLNRTGRSVASTQLAKMWDGSRCTLAQCDRNRPAPSVTCSPAVARSLDQNATCTAVYNYQAIGGNLISYLGFDSVFSIPIRATETFKVETRY